MQMIIRRIFIGIIYTTLVVPHANAGAWDWLKSKGQEIVNNGKKMVYTADNVADQISDGAVKTWNELGAFVGAQSHFSTVGAGVNHYEKEFSKNSKVGSVKFHTVCDIDEDANLAAYEERDETSVGGASQICDNEFFADINVGPKEAWALAKDFIKHQHNDSAVCSPTLRQYQNDDYIMCSSLGGKPTYYEIKFDDVMESSDNTNSGDMIDALCRIAGGELSMGTTCKGINLEKCTSVLLPLADPYSLGVEWKNKECHIYTESKSYLINEYSDIIDNKRFQTMQFNGTANVEFFVERYARKALAENGITMTSFECNKSTQNYNNDDVMTCFIGPNNPKITKKNANVDYAWERYKNDSISQVDFVFDDVRDTRDRKADAATAALKCLDTDGAQYDGEHCYGLDEAQCNAMDAEIPGGTIWDPVLDTCTLGKVALDNFIGEATDTVVTIGAVSLGIAAAVPTGGTSLTIVIIASATTASGMAMQEMGEEQAEKAVSKALNRTKTICRATPLDVMEFVETINAIDDALRKSDGLDNTWLDSALDDALALCIDGLTTVVNSPDILITQKEADAIIGMENMLKSDKSGPNIIKIGQQVELAGAVLSLFSGGASAAARAAGFGKYAKALKVSKSKNALSMFKTSMGKLNKISSQTTGLYSDSSSVVGNTGAFADGANSVSQKRSFRDFLQLSKSKVPQT